MPSRRSLRVLFVLVLLPAVLVVGGALATDAGRGDVASRLDRADGGSRDAAVAPPRDSITVVATDSNQWRGNSTDGPRATAELFALAPNGTVIYFDGSHDRYWDVDPVPGTEATVEYAYSDHLEGDRCPSSWDPESYAVTESRWSAYERVREAGLCTRNGVERADLLSGEVTPVWSQLTPGKEATRYHDADRLDDSRLVVADIYFDRVFVVHAASGRIEWTWNATDAFSTDTAGPYPKDWTHLNDVEVLEDGRVLASLRNLDQVVFLDDSGVVEGWTLGAEDDYATLHEQHNPDYLPPADGGPALLVADSENNRVVEYQREAGGWTRTWTWQDARLQWPRDADRLPNGHTLIADSNGDRVLEVDERGDVVWQLEVAFPYEVERFEPGDESAGGPSARAAGLASRSPGGGLVSALKAWLPGRYLNGLLYTTPVWMGLPELVALVGAAGVGLVWGLLELRWARRSRGRWLPL